MIKSLVQKSLLFVRQRFHPLWRLRRSRFYPWFESIFDRKVMRHIDGLGHPVAMQSLRDMSWWMAGANLEIETRRFLLSLLKSRPVNVFWDVGANIGFYSWLVRSQQTAAELVMFEPDPLNASLIRQTVTANNLKSISLIEAAVSNQEGFHQFVRDRVSGATGRLQEVDSAGDKMTIQGSYAKQNNEVVQVECRTLDGMVAAGFKAPDLMKVDVENAELLVVEGGERLFSKQHTMVLIEICDSRVFAFFDRHGYDIWVIEESSLNYFAAPIGILTDSELMKPYRRVEPQVSSQSAIAKI